MKIQPYYPDWWAKAIHSITNSDIVMKGLINKYPNKRLSSLRNPFFSLSKCIVGQQISVIAANAIWSRLIDNYDVVNGCSFKENDLTKLRKIGLSQRKASYLVNMSRMLKNYNNFDYWNKLNDEQVFFQLIKYKGIGPWSIKMFLIFCLNRPDIFSKEDIGLVKAIGKNYYDGERPDADEAEKLSIKWKPWRTVASWYLWRSIDPDVVSY